MSTSHTQNYNLSQWEKSDKVLMEDFNADNAKIDEAIKAEADARAALAKTLTRFGNCRIRTHSYVGAGTSGPDHPTVINFTGHPDFFIIFGGQGVMFGSYGQEATLFATDRSISSYVITPTWKGNQFSFSLTPNDPYPQLNASGTLYHVVEFYELI